MVADQATELGLIEQGNRDSGVGYVPPDALLPAARRAASPIFMRYPCRGIATFGSMNDADLATLIDAVKYLITAQPSFETVGAHIAKYGYGLSLFVGAIFAYLVQRLLDARRLKRIQRGLARAILHQVTEFVAETRMMQANLAKHAPDLLQPIAPDIDALLGGKISTGRFDRVAAWSTFVAVMAEKNPDIRSKLVNGFEWMSKAAPAMEERLSALKISGKDMADFPDSAMSTYVVAQRGMSQFRVAFEALATSADREGPMDVGMMQGAWLAIGMRSDALNTLRVALIAPSGMRPIEAAQLLERREREIEKELAESTAKASTLADARQAIVELADQLGWGAKAPSATPTPKAPPDSPPATTHASRHALRVER